MRYLMAKTINSINFQDFSNKWIELLPDLLGQISLNANQFQTL